MCLYEKVIKVKADVAALLSLFSDISLRTRRNTPASARRPSHRRSFHPCRSRPGQKEKEGNHSTKERSSTELRCASECFVKYIEAMRAEGITIDAITVENEPLKSEEYAQHGDVCAGTRHVHCERPGARL
jgi:hypothetical protein